MRGKRWLFVLGFLLTAILIPVSFHFSHKGNLDLQPSVAHAQSAGSIAGAAVGGVVPATIGALSPSDPNCKASTLTSLATGDIGCLVLSLFKAVLGLIVDLLGGLVTILIEILLAFAKYNGFATATPVIVGWKIVRDLCNMFFIVILLISAFATILQYRTNEFHYTVVLPKLLLSAVLINFSRTLIQLLIDFSQVVMLTFVNAFYQAGAGNFTQALGLTRYLQFVQSSASTQTTGQAAASFTNIIIAYLLAVILLVITTGVIVIMIGYIIARIIGLWIALIFSPIALFELAVPAKLQKGMSTFTGKYWKKLGAMLSGGPIIAFFLWLTLATVQQTAAEGTLAQSLGLFTDDHGFAAGFISNIGNTQGIASFIIAIAMMMLGLDAAIEAADDLGSGILKDFTKKVASRTRGYAEAVALAPYRLGRAAVRGAAQGAEQRLDLRGQLAGAGLQVTRGLSSTNFGAAVPGLRAATQGFARAEISAKAARKKQIEAEKVDISQMSSKDQRAYLTATRPGATATPVQRLAWADMAQGLAADDARFKRTKELAKENEEKIKAQEEAKVKADANYKKLEADEIKRMASSQAMMQANAEAAQFLADAKEFNTKEGRGDKNAEIDKMIEKNPLLEKDEKKRTDLLAKTRVDPDKVKDLSAEALSRGGTVLDLLPETAIVRDEQTKAIKGFDSAQIARIKAEQNGKPLEKNLDAMINYVSNSRGAVIPESRLRNMVFQKGRRGEVLTYDGQTGMRLENETIRQTRDAIKAGPTNPNPIRDFVQAGGYVRELEGLGVTPDTVASMVQTSSEQAAQASAANDPAALRRALDQMKPFIDNMADLSPDAREKAVVAAAKQDIGHWATERFTDFRPDQRQSLIEFVKTAQATVARIDHGQSKLEPADQQKVSDLMTQLKDAAGPDMPRPLRETIENPPPTV